MKSEGRFCFVKGARRVGLKIYKASSSSGRRAGTGLDRPSICYIVPYCAPEESSHMAHLPRFLSEVGKRCNVHVIVQQGKECPKILNTRSVYLQRPGNHFSRAVELIRIANRLRKEGCQRFFIRISASAGFELGLVGRLLGLKIYYWVSGQGKDLRPSWRREFVRRLYYQLNYVVQRGSMRLAHRFVTGPESMVDYYEREFGVRRKKVIVLYNDVDVVDIDRRCQVFSKETARLSLGIEKPARVVLFVGRVSLLKGGMNLLPLAHRLLGKCSDATILVVGQVHIPSVVKEAQRLQLSNLQFRGPVPNHKLHAYYRAADVFILPSEEQGFPRVLIEAMAHGTPVVCFDVGGVRDIVHPKQLQFVVPRGDIQTLVEKVVMLLSDPQVWAGQAAAGLEAVKRFSTERVATMFMERIVHG